MASPGAAHSEEPRPPVKHGARARVSRDPRAPSHRLMRRVSHLKQRLAEVPARWTAWPLVMLRNAATLGLTAVRAWSADRCSSMAASLAFYSAFSLAPMLVVIIAVAGFFFGAEAVQGQLFEDIAGLVGRDGAVVIQAMVASAGKAHQGALAGALSVGAIALGASATFAALTDALNVIWRAPPHEAPIATLIRIRLTSFGLVIGTGFLLVVLLIADAALKALTRQILVWGPWLDPIADLLQQTVTFGFLSFAFAVMLKILPDLRVRWRDAAVGAISAAVLFTGGKHFFALYLAGAGTANVIGAAGAITAVMMWLYFSGAVFLLGAEISAHASGARANSGKADDAIADRDGAARGGKAALLR